MFELERVEKVLEKCMITTDVSIRLQGLNHIDLKIVNPFNSYQLQATMVSGHRYVLLNYY